MWRGSWSSDRGARVHAQSSSEGEASVVVASGDEVVDEGEQRKVSAKTLEAGQRDKGPVLQADAVGQGAAVEAGGCEGSTG